MTNLLKDKKALLHIADRIFWLVVALLPVLGYVAFLIGQGSTSSINGLSYFSAWFDSSGFGIPTTNIFYDCIMQIFGSSGVLPLFSQSAVVKYLSYFISVELIHLVIDILLFLPRLFHNWIDNSWRLK